MNVTLQSRRTHTDSSRRHPTAMGPAQAVAAQAIPEPSLAGSRPRSARYQHATHQHRKLTQSRLIKAVSHVHLQPALRLLRGGCARALGPHAPPRRPPRITQRRLIRSSVHSRRPHPPWLGPTLEERRESLLFEALCQKDDKVS